jgi:hypothetical protein
MSTKYVISKWWPAKITAHECIKETASFVWLKGFYFGDKDGIEKLKKNGDIFDTWAEAHAELTRRAEAKLATARRHLEVAQGFAGNVRGMKPPQEDPTP